MDTVTILSSGMGFGVYNPSLLLYHQLQERGGQVEFAMEECLFTEEKLQKLRENQEAFHDNIQVAKMAMRLPLTGQQNQYDTIKTTALWRHWAEQGRSLFLIVSGHWEAILGQYIARFQPLLGEVQVKKLHMDCDMAPSWKHREWVPGEDIWLFGKYPENASISYHLPVGTAEPLSFPFREKRVVMHGGGWGIGIRQDRAKALQDAGFCVDILDSSPPELPWKDEEERGIQTYFIGSWYPWEKETGVYRFPPLYRMTQTGESEIPRPPSHHCAYDLYTGAAAILSKPGGGTLLDSLASATPLLFTEPIAKHEKANGEMWAYHGFGLPYADWARSGFPMDVLKQCHQKLMQARCSTGNLADYLWNWIQMQPVECVEPEGAKEYATQNSG